MMKPTPLKKYIKTCDKALCRHRAWWRVDTGDTIAYLCDKHMNDSRGAGKEVNRSPRKPNGTKPGKPNGLGLTTRPSPWGVATPHERRHRRLNHETHHTGG